VILRKLKNGKKYIPSDYVTQYGTVYNERYRDTYLRWYQNYNTHLEINSSVLMVDALDNRNLYMMFVIIYQMIDIFVDI
jgi:hypothetical protein